jgi:hypothetical protein
MFMHSLQACRHSSQKPGVSSSNGPFRVRCMELACTLPAVACCMQQTFACWLCAGWTHVCR